MAAGANRLPDSFWVDGGGHNGDTVVWSCCQATVVEVDKKGAFHDHDANLEFESVGPTTDPGSPM